MNLGTLLVQLNADSKGMVKGMASAAEAVEKFARETKKLANDVAQVSGALLAVGAGALALASTVDRSAKASFDRLKASMALVAVQIYDLLKPAIESLGSTFRTLADYIAGLDPATRSQIATWAVYVAQVAVAAKALGMVAGLVDGLAGAFSALSGVVGGMGVVAFVDLLAAMALIIGTVVLLHRAWRQNWAGIQEFTHDVVQRHIDMFVALGNVVERIWNGIVDSVIRHVEFILNAVDGLQGVFGKKLFDTSGAREGLAGLAKDMKSANFFQPAVDLAKGVAVDAKNAIIEEMGIIFGEAKKALGVAGFARGKAREASGFGSTSQGSKIDWRADEEASARELAEKLAKASEETWKARDDFEKESRLEYESASEFAKKQRETQEAAAKAIKEKAKAVLGIALSSLGALGETVNAIAQGAQAGGVWGAIIAAVMEVFKRMESFQRLLRFFEQGLARLGQFLEPLVGPLFDMVGQALAMATDALGPLFDALTPLFSAIATVAKQLFEPIADVSKTLSALAPILKVFFSVVGSFMEAMSVLDIGTKGIIWSTKIAMAGLLGFVAVLNDIAAVFGDEKAKAEAARLRGVIEGMFDPNSSQQAAAQAAATASAWDVAAANNAAAASVTSVAESLLNVPTGYKVALARFNAIDANGSTYQRAMAGGGSGGAGLTVNGDLNVNGADAESIDDIAREARKEAARQRAQRRGNPVDPREP